MVASKNITLNILGDASGANKAMDTVGAKAESTSSRAAGAFKGLSGSLASTGMLGPLGDGLDRLSGAFDSLTGKSATMGTKLMGVGAAGMGAGAMLIASAGKDETAHAQLQQAIENTGNSMDDYQKRIDSAVKSQAKFGTTSGDTQNALQMLTQATHDPAKALDDLSIAANLAAAKHESLGEATTQMAAILAGKGAKTLQQYGITLDASIKDPTARGQKALEQLAQATSGQASAAADTFAGHLKGLKAEIENGAASIGQKYGPAITGLGAAATGVGAIIEGASGPIKKMAGALGLVSTATEVKGTAEAAETPFAWASLVPILLIVAAVAILALGIYELITHWKAVWGAVKDVIGDAWKFITGIVGTIVSFITSHWQLLLAILTGPFGLAVLFIKDHFNEIMSFIGGLPGRIASIASTMWDGIKDAFRSVINFVISLWNRLHFTLPKIDLGPLGKIGGGTIGVPQIPYLSAGADIMGPTLALLGEAGPERVMPLGSQGGMGSAQGGDIVLQIDGQTVGRVLGPFVRDGLLSGRKNSVSVGLG